MIKRRCLLQNGVTRAISIGLFFGVGTSQAEFPADFELSSLNGTNGAVLSGVATEDNAGQSVSSAGDINGDGISDLVVGAPCASTGPVCAGAAYVVYGNQQGLQNPLNLFSINENNGVVIRGKNAFDFVGDSVNEAGDVNGDGFDDLIVGASGWSSPDASYAGAALVVFGSNTGLPSPVDFSDLNGINGFAILGVVPNAYIGSSVSGAGDINGDGFDDVIIGAPDAGNGIAYVVFGSNQFDATLSVSSLIGSNGFIINGINEGDELGRSVAAAGDINGDGRDDLVLGARLAEFQNASPGAAYVVFGRALGQPWPAIFDLSALHVEEGFTIVGHAHFEYTGFSVAAAGDINGDGLDDIIVGAPGPGSDPEVIASGSSYVVFGTQGGFNPSLEVSGLDGTNGFAIHGAATGDRSGASVSAAGDINGDGIDDLIIGAPGADPSGDASGASYVVFGRPQGQSWPRALSLASLNGTDGFSVNGVSFGDESGTSVSVAGDINVDGSVDFLVGAPFRDANGVDSGVGYVVYEASIANGDIIFADSFEQ